jgi:ABC-2 type transport system permease protein
VYSTDPTSVDPKVLARLLLPLNLHLTTHVDLERARTLTTVPVEVRGVGSRFENLETAQLARGITFTLIFLLYLLVILNSQLTMAGVIEEKTNRIAELLVSAVDPVALLYGKILAGTTLGIVQMAAWIGAALIAGVSGAPSAAASASGASPFSLAGALGGALSPVVIVSFLCFFIIGLLQFTTIFAGIGSLISRPEDLGAINSAMVLPIVAALLIAIAALDAPNAPVVVISSYIPLLAPFTMFARIATAAPPLWQIACSAAINAIALAGIALLAGKLYRVGMLLYGRPPSLKQVWMTLKA